MFVSLVRELKAVRGVATEGNRRRAEIGPRVGEVGMCGAVTEVRLGELDLDECDMTRARGAAGAQQNIDLSSMRRTLRTLAEQVQRIRELELHSAHPNLLSPKAPQNCTPGLFVERGKQIQR